MKKKRYSVKALVQKAIIDSMNFSKENGSQIFIEVYPHVEGVHLYAYQDGWEASKKRSFDIYIYTRGSLAPSVKDAKKMLKPVYDFIKENQKI